MAFAIENGRAVGIAVGAESQDAEDHVILSTSADSAGGGKKDGERRNERLRGAGDMSGAMPPEQRQRTAES